MGVHLDGTITLGSIISAFAFLTAAIGFWVEVRWRIRSLEDWRREVSADNAKRDEFIRKLDIANEHLRTLIVSRVSGGRRFTDPQLEGA